mgnify:FL=1
MCKYCEEDKRKKRDCIINTPIVSLRIIRNNGFNALAIKSYNLEKQVVDSYQTINYCPKCRKEAGRVRVMISQPMANRTEEDVRQERKVIIEKFNNMHIDVIDTIFTDEVPIDYNAGVYYLGKSIKEMSKADALFMCDGWREARGCKIERQVAQDYGIKILYEDFFVNKPELGTEESYDK